MDKFVTDIWYSICFRDMKHMLAHVSQVSFNDAKYFKCQVKNVQQINITFVYSLPVISTHFINTLNLGIKIN